MPVNIAPVMTSDTTPAPYVVWSNTTYGDPYYVWKAFNGIKDTFEGYITQDGGGGLPATIKVDYGSAIYGFSGYMIKQLEANYSAQSWTFEGSNDDVNWTVLDTQTNQTTWAAYEERTFTFALSQKYRYVRLVVTVQNTAGRYFGWNEVELYGSSVGLFFKSFP